MASSCPPGMLVQGADDRSSIREELSTEQSWSGDLETVVVTCAGGLWDGIFCFNDQGSSFCYFTRTVSDDVVRPARTTGNQRGTSPVGDVDGGEVVDTETAMAPLERDEKPTALNEDGGRHRGSPRKKYVMPSVGST